MLYLDLTTMGLLENSPTPSGRAAAVLASLTGPITVTVRDGSGNVKGQGTMTNFGTLSSNVIVVGQVDSFEVTETGSPDPATWTVEFSNESGRLVKGRFGLASNPYSEFKWTLPTWEDGQSGTISNTYLTVPKREVLQDATSDFDVAATPTNTAPVWTQGTPSSLTLAAGGTYNLASHAYDADGNVLTFSKVSGSGTVASNGLFTAGSTSGTVVVRVSDGLLSADTSIYITVTTVAPATYIIPANGASNTSRTYDGSSTTGFNGTSWVTTGGVTRRPQAGDIIELAAGTHGVTRFSNIIGTVSNRITIRGPAAGVAVIRRLNPATGDFIVRLTNCRYFNFDGYSTAGNRNCGIRVTYAQNSIAGTGTTNKDGPSSFIKWFQKTDNCRMSYVEIAGGWEYNGTSEGSGFAHTGLGMETGDTGNTITAYPGGQFQENIELSHFYIHKTRGEGLYLGPNWDDVPREIPVRNIELHHSYFYRNGSGGAQGKCWFEGNNSMHHNTIIQCGLRGGVVNQRRALAILSGCGRIHDNWIEDEGGESTMVSTYSGVNPGGIMFFTDVGPIKNELDAGLYGPYSTFKVYAYNNLIFNCGNTTLPAQGISMGHTSGVNCVDPEPYIFNNTIVGCSSVGLQISSAVGGFARNNIVVANVGGNITTSGSTSVVSDNTTASTVGTRFVNVASNDYRLQATDTAVGTVGADGPIALTDLDGNPRSAGTADKGCYEKL